MQMASLGKYVKNVTRARLLYAFTLTRLSRDVTYLVEKPTIEFRPRRNIPARKIPLPFLRERKETSKRKARDVLGECEIVSPRYVSDGPCAWLSSLPTNKRREMFSLSLSLTS